MLGVNEGNEVDGEGAQSLQNNIWLGGESEETPGQAGTASPGIPNMSTISMDSSNTTEVVNIEYVASEEQIFKVSLAVNVASTTKQGIRDLREIFSGAGPYFALPMRRFREQAQPGLTSWRRWLALVVCSVGIPIWGKWAAWRSIAREKNVQKNAE